MTMTVTPTARDAVRRLVEATPVADEKSGLRITRPYGTTFNMRIVAGPQREDTEVQSGDARVFVSPDAAEFLDGVTLHARLETRRVRFMLVEAHG